MPRLCFWVAYVCWSNGVRVCSCEYLVYFLAHVEHIYFTFRWYRFDIRLWLLYTLCYHTYGFIDIHLYIVKEPTLNCYEMLSGPNACIQ